MKKFIICLLVSGSVSAATDSCLDKFSPVYFTGQCFQVRKNVERAVEKQVDKSIGKRYDAPILTRGANNGNQPYSPIQKPLP